MDFELVFVWFRVCMYLVMLNCVIVSLVSMRVICGFELLLGSCVKSWVRCCVCSFMSMCLIVRWLMMWLVVRF